MPRLTANLRWLVVTCSRLIWACSNFIGGFFQLAKTCKLFEHKIQVIESLSYHNLSWRPRMKPILFWIKAILRAKVAKPKGNWKKNEITDRGSMQKRLFETPFQWTIIRNVTSKKRQTILRKCRTCDDLCLRWTDVIASNHKLTCDHLRSRLIKA